jgi:predicted aspartyl protease
MFRLAILILGLGLATATPALGDYYKWTDKDGVTHYGQIPPEQHRQDAVQYKEIGKAKASQLRIPSTMRMAPAEQGAGGTPGQTGAPAATSVLIEHNAVYVPVTFTSTFGKVTTARMLLDTGANITVIHSDLAHRAGAEVQWGGSVRVAGGGLLSAGMASFRQLAVGPYATQNVKVAVIRNRGDRKHDGLLGNDFLKQVAFQVDYRRKRIVWQGRQ